MALEHVREAQTQFPVLNNMLGNSGPHGDDLSVSCVLAAFQYRFDHQRNNRDQGKG